MYQTTEEECVISFLALARFAKLDMMEMREAVEDIKIQCAQWDAYVEAAENDEWNEEEGDGYAEEADEEAFPQHEFDDMVTVTTSMSRTMKRRMMMRKPVRQRLIAWACARSITGFTLQAVESWSQSSLQRLRPLRMQLLPESDSSRRRSGVIRILPNGNRLKRSRQGNQIASRKRGDALREASLMKRESSARGSAVLRKGES